MSKYEKVRFVPWDSLTFGIHSYEVLEYSAEALQQCLDNGGHYSLKVDPLADKKLLFEYGFYYCDTLLEPFCTENNLRIYEHTDTTISKLFDKNDLIEICNGVFEYGRYHRDFNLPKLCSNIRYNKWLEQLIDENNVYGLYWQGELAGFIGHQSNKLVLHALCEKFRGQGLSKYWWSLVCQELFANGNETLQSSISATNLAVLNLYSSLGFSFKNAKDIYHCLVN